jgi:hypothetical protein
MLFHIIPISRPICCYSFFYKISQFLKSLTKYRADGGRHAFTRARREAWALSTGGGTMVTGARLGWWCGMKAAALVVFDMVRAVCWQ